MAKNYVQPGVVVSVTLTAATDSGELIKVGSLVGVALKSGANGDTISVQIGEVFTVAKLSTDNVAQGAVVYLDEANKRVTLAAASGDNIRAGVAFSASGAGVATLQLKLNA